MKPFISVLIITILITFNLYSQTHTFLLGFSGTYPDGMKYGETQSVNWSWYTEELNMNFWQGFYLGDNHPEVLDKLDSFNLNGMFDIDTIRWAAFGRIDIHEAEETTDRFRYDGHRCGSPMEDWQFGGGDTVMYYNKNEQCNQQSPEGLVLWNVHENGGQSFGTADPVKEVWFNGNNVENTWYIKPKIRISTDDALGPLKNVCKLMVIAYNGETINEFIITTQNFRDVSQFSYDGRYLEVYWDLPISVPSSTTNGINKGRPTTFQNPDWNNCHVDYQIYWYGTVNMWVDYVKIMNRPANIMFGPNPIFDIWQVLYRKANTLVTRDGSNDKMKGFYTEEIDYGYLRCMRAVNDFLAAEFNNSDKVKIHGLVNWYSYYVGLKTKNRNADYQAYINMVHPPGFYAVYYPFSNFWDIREYYRPKLPNNVSFVNNGHYPQPVIDYMQGQYGIEHMKVVNNEEYTTHIQRILDDYADTMNYFNGVSRESGLRFYSVPQVCEWKQDLGEWQREPMNPEIGAEFGISICRGAQGIMPFDYGSSYNPNGNFNFGMTDFDQNIWWGYMKRNTNFYGENKWEYVKNYYAKIKVWAPVLANSPNTTGYSVHLSTANQEFISDIKSIYRNPSTPFDFGPGNEDGTKYWEMGFFSPNYLPVNDKSKYFMMVNRRCIPEIQEGEGDIRQLKIKFDSTDLASFRNWKLIDVYTGNSVTFANSNSYIDLGNTTTSLGYFNPGEAKLFKLAPVMQEGGLLVTDEYVYNQAFRCYDTVYNNCKNIVITGTNTIISFENSADIEFDSGLFQSGEVSDNGPLRITYSSTTQWPGFHIINGTVKIYGSKFEKLGAGSNETFALALYDCGLTDIRNSIFSNSNNNEHTGGITNVYYFIEEPSEVNQYFIGNTFTMNFTTLPALQLQSFASIVVPVYIQSNVITGSGNASNAIMLSYIYNGVVDQNTITGFVTGINTLSSDISLYGNIITNTEYESRSLYCVEASNLFMSQTGDYLFGGVNTFTNSIIHSKNVEVENSKFNIYDGQNTFDVESTQYESYHVNGTFPSRTYSTSAEYNCFKLDGSAVIWPALPHYDITSGGYPVTLTFYPYSCAGGGEGDAIAVDIGNGVYDTVITSPGGGGGGSSMSEMRLEISELEAKNKPTSSGKIIITPASAKFDSLCILMRFRNYSAARNKAIELISTYPDSTQTLNSLGMLYYTSLVTDTSQIGALSLKTFYENLILNHPSNTFLAGRSNYFVQKCKVRLRQYSSAMSGFQQIMNQNPYSYEALLAKWDYMATNILDSLSGGSIRGDGDDDDRSPFNREERKQIKENTRTVFERARNLEERHIEKLVKLSESGNINARKELEKKRALKELIKPEHPRTIIEHIRFVNNDINKIFGTNISGDIQKNISVPLVYRLAQNYPNPFNPVTIIRYELPKDSKVKLVVYDLLGREVKTLVNAIKSAGYYQIESNMQNYASGVYFCRIEADDLKGKKFIDAKKLVLVK